MLGVPEEFETLVNIIFLVATGAIAVHGIRYRNEEGKSDTVRLLFGCIAAVFFVLVLLQDVLGLRPRPRYWHLPMVVGPDGRRLAKRHGDTRVAHYRAGGVTAHRLLGLLGYWCGILDQRRPTDVNELLDRFSIEQLPPEQIVYSPEDDRYLTAAKT